MSRFAILAALVVVGSVSPVVAQFCRPVIVVRFSYGGAYGWGGMWVPPPVIVVRPRAVPRYEFDEPREAQPLRANPAEKVAAAARVSAAVERGELKVFKPGQFVARVPAPRNDQPLMGAELPVTLDPPKPPADPKALAVFRVAVGRAAFASGEYGRAADRFRAASVTDPQAFFLLAQAHTARGEYAEAVTAIREGMRKTPDWPRSRFRIVDLYGERRDALANHLTILRTAATGDSVDPATQFLYAYHLWFADERAAAVKVFRELSPTVKDNAVIERFLQVAEGKDL